MIESVALSEIVVLMKDENWRVRLAVANAISSLAGHGMSLLESTTRATTDPSSDDIRATIIESDALSETIALMKDETWRVRLAVVNAISGLAGHGINFLRTTTTH